MRGGRTALLAACLLAALSACDRGGASFCESAREWTELRAEFISIAGGRPQDTPEEIERMVQEAERRMREHVERGLKLWRAMEQSAPEIIKADVATMSRWYHDNLTADAGGLIGRVPPTDVQNARIRAGAHGRQECGFNFQA